MHSHARTSAKIDATRFYVVVCFLLFFLRKSRGEVLKKILTGSFKFKVSDVNATLPLRIRIGGCCSHGAVPPCFRAATT